ncbi:D-alanyl-D-alanine carboxypeptidase family protein [Aureimonas frigidaquae]|uniref:D-alanyl-D-alanine carboxypeptidase family protein n=1 Tax=Aureimonas frigidaquae TaxID=424757 RepID=UPI000781BBAD|nr:D-alanyl-D-alanine carboxypeptidase family protein [Aureimonas frigidaquae]
MHRPFLTLLLLLMTVLALPTGQALAADRYAVIVIDAHNGSVLKAVNADARRYPASLTKMMTLYMAFDALKAGRMRMDTQLPVSAYAAARPPSKLALRAGSTISAHDALLGLATRSANDASSVVAEYLGGSEQGFARMMTERAHALGMRSTVFRNPHGLPDKEHVTTARDLARLGLALRRDFPQYYGLFSVQSFPFQGQTIRSHNHLLGRVKGLDGLKTGFTNAAGFNLATSVVRGRKSIVAVILGGTSVAARDREMVKLIEETLPRASDGPAEPLMASAKGIDWQTTVGSVVAASTPAKATATAAVAAEAAAPVTAVASAADVPVPRAAQREPALILASAPGGATRAMAQMLRESEPAQTAHALQGTGALALVADDDSEVGTDALPSALTDIEPAEDISEPVPAPASREMASLAVASATPQAEARSAAAPAAADGPERWIIQIAATPAMAIAMDMLAEARQGADGMLDEKLPIVTESAAGSVVLYRARFAGFRDHEEADVACVLLAARSIACRTMAVR